MDCATSAMVQTRLYPTGGHLSTVFGLHREENPASLPGRWGNYPRWVVFSGIRVILFNNETKGGIPMKRTRLADRRLPSYSRGEEIMNMVTHIVGGALGVVALVLCVIRAAGRGNLYGVIASVIYGVSMIALYTMSSVYHGLRPGMAKKVMQVIDHCTIYFLISGSYTPFALSAIRPVYPALGWGLFTVEWALTALAVTMTAIDLKKYNVFSKICYIGMGWAIIPFAGIVIETVTFTGFLLVLSGGIAYTIGAVLYGIGSKKPWMHSVFHIFVVLGSLLQFFSIYFFAL